MKGIKEISKLTKKIKELEGRLKRIDLDNVIPIVGDYGSGKSALCHYLIYSICKHGFEEYIPVFVPLGQLPRHDELTNYLRNDIYEFVKKEYEFNISNNEFSRKLDDGRVILILDALDEMSNKLDNEIAQS